MKYLISAAAAVLLIGVASVSGANAADWVNCPDGVSKAVCKSHNAYRNSLTVMPPNDTDAFIRSSIVREQAHGID
jgi:hypothetical protein